MFDKKLVTVWSAPNFHYRSGNLASILTFHTANDSQIKIFDAVPLEQRRIPDSKTSLYFL